MEKINERIEALEKRVGYLESDLVAPDVKVVELGLKVKEIEEGLREIRSALYTKIIKGYLEERDAKKPT